MSFNRQYFDIIKNNGFKYSKDAMGYYFDKDDEKFSIIKTGPYCQCFYNKLIDNTWKLQKNSYHLTNFNDCLIWIIENLKV